MSFETKYSVVSCHVERLLDDAIWARLERLVERRPAGFAIAPLVRPPDPAAAESQEVWAERARRLAGLGLLGHHTHFGGVTQARPTAAGAAERVRREADAFARAGLRASFFCGGGWYMDADVAATAAALGYVDCSATSYRQPYLAADAPSVRVPEPTWLRLAGGERLLELPATHSVGMLLRDLLRRRPLEQPVVHLHFHDWDLADPRRRLALSLGLAILGRVRRPLDLDRLAETAAA
ncbi:MAG TPA: hypothetical protein VFI37_11040, partial [Gaiellaceae bacterium]|nr:hypothetical protein [Gaiellaceae bacterium]